MARSRDEVAKDCEIAEALFHNARARTIDAQTHETECSRHLLKLEAELEAIDFGTDFEWLNDDLDPMDFDTDQDPLGD
jgi:hypothetical protein